MEKQNRNNVLSKGNIFTRALICGLIITLLFSAVGFDTSCGQIRDSVLRLHILANSDSVEDQQLKLSVRDRMLEITNEMFVGCGTKEEAITAAENNRDRIKSAAQEVIEAAGRDYGVEVNIAKNNFDTRDYENFSLPAGEYDSIQVIIGEGEGQNWWCVMFPPVCVPACCDASISDVLNEDGTEIVENRQRYEVGFKVVEWYEKLKSSLSQ